MSSLPLPGVTYYTCTNARALPFLWDHNTHVHGGCEPHHTPHFHAYYQEDVAVISLEPVDLIAGSLPRRQRRLVEAWAELHQEELLVAWQRLQAGQSPTPIDPL